MQPEEKLEALIAYLESCLAEEMGARLTAEWTEILVRAIYQNNDSGPRLQPAENTQLFEVIRIDAGNSGEELLGASYDAEIAATIFDNCAAEHPNLRIVLRNGAQTLKKTF
jgi:hypothetical protein